MAPDQTVKFANHNAIAGMIRECYINRLYDPPITLRDIESRLILLGIGRLRKEAGKLCKNGHGTEEELIERLSEYHRKRQAKLPLIFSSYELQIAGINTWGENESWYDPLVWRLILKYC